MLGCSLSVLIEHTSAPEEGTVVPGRSQRSSVQSGCVCECLNGSSDGHSSIMWWIACVLMTQNGHEWVNGSSDGHSSIMWWMALYKFLFNLSYFHCFS